jgi:hypothetical protein
MEGLLCRVHELVSYVYSESLSWVRRPADRTTP